MDWTQILLFLLIVFPFCWKFSQSFRFYVKLLYFNIIVTLVTGVCILPIAIWRPKDVQNFRAVSWAWTKLFVELPNPILNLKYEVRQGEFLVSEKPCVIVSNHQSSLDVIGLQYLLPERCTFLAKKSLQYAGSFGLAAWLCGIVFVDRSNHQKAQQTMKHVVDRIHNENLKLWIFPEGTRSMRGELLPFKKGAFNIAVEAQVPIVPLVFSSYKSFYDKKRRKFESGKIIVQCLSPVSTEGLTTEDVPDLAEKIRSDMGAVFADISADLPDAES